MNSSNYSKVEHFFFGLCEKYDVVNINRLPLTARKALIDKHIKDGKLFSVDMKEKMKITGIQIDSRKDRFMVTLEGGSTVMVWSMLGYKRICEAYVRSELLSADDILKFSRTYTKENVFAF